jgi:hypothetical protein
MTDDLNGFSAAPASPLFVLITLLKGVIMSPTYGIIGEFQAAAKHYTDA